ncbi:hypothetical protein H9658_03005 [Xanthomonas sp. Sa3BUA13]|nr:hypothetical protein [Xanthomonas surreyensis]
MPQRRHLLKTAAFCAIAIAIATSMVTALPRVWAAASKGVTPLPRGAARVIPTWDFGIAANQAAWHVLSRGGVALDAVEAGVWVPEADVNNPTAGLGGYPDRGKNLNEIRRICGGGDGCSN